MRVEKLTWYLPGFYLLSLQVFPGETCWFKTKWLSIPGFGGIQGYHIPKDGSIESVRAHIHGICGMHEGWLSKPDFPCIWLYALFQGAAKTAKVASMCWDMEEVGCYKDFSQETKELQCKGRIMIKEGRTKKRGDITTLQACLDLFTTEIKQKEPANGKSKTKKQSVILPIPRK